MIMDWDSICLNLNSSPTHVSFLFFSKKNFYTHSSIQLLRIQIKGKRRLRKYLIYIS